MRLIDADVLKSEFEWLKSVVNESSKDEVQDAIQRIENAPTVDAVILPCKLGETVYVIRECSCYCADDNKKNKRKKCCTKVYLGKRLRTYHCGYVTEAKFDLKHIADFGNMVFLTREEAEAALAERKRNDQQ